MHSPVNINLSQVFPSQNNHFIGKVYQQSPAIDGDGSPVRVDAGIGKKLKKSNTVMAWTLEDDRLLANLVKKHGEKQWVAIAEKLKGRTNKQCRERWVNYLRPNIKMDSWTEQEERIIILSHMEFGNRWVKMANRLPGRTENAIKNHWNATKRRLTARKPWKSRLSKKPPLLQEYIKHLVDPSLDAASKLVELNQSQESGCNSDSMASLNFTSMPVVGSNVCNDSNAHLFNQGTQSFLSQNSIRSFTQPSAPAVPIGYQVNTSNNSLMIPMIGYSVAGDSRTMTEPLVAKPIGSWNGGSNSASVVPWIHTGMPPTGYVGRDGRADLLPDFPSSYLAENTVSFTQPLAAAGSTMAVPTGIWKSGCNHVSQPPMNVTSMPVLELGVGNDGHVDLFTLDLQSSSLGNYNRSLTQSLALAASVMTTPMENRDDGLNNTSVIAMTLTNVAATEQALVASAPNGDMETGWKNGSIASVALASMPVTEHNVAKGQDLYTAANLDVNNMPDFMFGEVWPGSIRQEVQPLTASEVVASTGHHSGCNNGSIAPANLTSMHNMGEDDVMVFFAPDAPSCLLENNLQSLDQITTAATPTGYQESGCNNGSMALTTFTSLPATQANVEKDDDLDSFIASMDYDDIPDLMSTQWLPDGNDGISCTNTDSISYIQASTSTMVAATSGNPESGCINSPPVELNMGKSNGMDVFFSHSPSSLLQNKYKSLDEPSTMADSNVNQESGCNNGLMPSMALASMHVTEPSMVMDDDWDSFADLDFDSMHDFMFTDVLPGRNDEISCTNGDQPGKGPLAVGSNTIDRDLDDLPACLFMEALPGNDIISCMNINKPGGDPAEMGQGMEMEVMPHNNCTNIEPSMEGPSLESGCGMETVRNATSAFNPDDLSDSMFTKVFSEVDDINCTTIDQLGMVTSIEKGCGLYVMEDNVDNWSLDDFPDYIFIEVSPRGYDGSCTDIVQQMEDPDMEIARNNM